VRDYVKDPNAEHNINKRTKSSIEWLVYKPGLRRNSGFFFLVDYKLKSS